MNRFLLLNLFFFIINRQLVARPLFTGEKSECLGFIARSYIIIQITFQKHLFIHLTSSFNTFGTVQYT